MTGSDPIAATVRSRFQDGELRFLSEALPLDLSIADYGIEVKGSQLSIYHPAFDAMVLRSKKNGVILAENTYLSSFAYNMGAVWLKHGHEHALLKNYTDCSLVRLMQYNFKKFFAEQILRRTHNIFGLGIFLETLLYEEAEMRTILAADQITPEEHQTLNSIARLMTSLILFHEAAHIYRDRITNFKAEILKDAPKECRDIADEWDKFPEAAAAELECDAFAALLMSRQVIPALDTQAIFRFIVLGFALFAAMQSLDRSAAETAKRYPASAEDCRRDDILNDLGGAEFVVGKDEFMLYRAVTVSKLVEVLAGNKAVQLYDEAGTPCLPSNIVPLLNDFILDIVTATKPSYRGMCEMVARALHGHRDSIDYLVWRSKKFFSLAGS